MLWLHWEWLQIARNDHLLQHHFVDRTRAAEHTWVMEKQVSEAKGRDESVRWFLLTHGSNIFFRNSSISKVICFLHSTNINQLFCFVF